MSGREYDEAMMRLALREAEAAAAEGEVPVGAVVVRGGEVIASGRNGRETGRNALHHAEIQAINAACRALGGWRLIGCELFVTLEPCPMCTGAIINSRIERVVYGAPDPKAGSCGSVVNLFDLPYNHKPELEPRVLEKECSELLSFFFRELRAKKQKQEKMPLHKMD